MVSPVSKGPQNLEAQKQLIRAADETISTLQKLWENYQNSLNPAQETEIAKTTQYLAVQLKAKITDPSLIKQRQIQSDFLLACQEQLGQMKGYSYQAKTAPISEKDLPKRKEAFASKKAPLPSNLAESYRYHFGRRQEAIDLLAADGLEKHNVPGDGSCGIHSIVRSLNPTATVQRATELRAELIEKMRTLLMAEVEKGTGYKYLAFLGYASYTKQGQTAAVNDYCKRMSSTRAWIGQVELCILSEILERPIWVYRTDNLKVDEQTQKLVPQNEYRYGTEQTKEPILLWHDSGHYQYLAKKA